MILDQADAVRETGEPEAILGRAEAEWRAIQAPPFCVYQGDSYLRNVLVRRAESGEWEVRHVDFELARDVEDGDLESGAPLCWTE